MKRSYYLSLALVFMAFLSACESKQMKEEMVSKTDMSEPALLIEQAKQSFNDINSLGYAWRDTEDMIKEAEKALLLGERDKAEKLANEAIFQNKMAKIQYEREKNAGPL